ncbi:MAG: DNA polymerase III subunit beta [Ignavibacteria bacterium]|nr:DNA polymerase III subunit beta [Ignavibacteria bacterium]
MKFSITVENFVNYLTKLSYVIPTRSALPILENVLFELNGNELTLQATDLENFIRVKVLVEGQEDGECAIPAKRLLELMRLLTAKYENINVETDFDLEDYDLLNKETDLNSLFKGKIIYVYKSKTLIFKGVFENEFKLSLLEKLGSNQQTYVNENRHELASANERLKNAIEKLYEKNENTLSKLMAKKKIKFETNEKYKVTITSSNGKYSFFGQATEDFPSIEDKNQLEAIKIKDATLRRVISKVRHAVSQEETKRNMTGILFDIRKNEFRFVSTDGFRLSKLTLKDYEATDAKESKIIVALKAADIITKLTGQEESTIEYDDTLIKLTTDTTEFYSKLIDDTFPNYETVIPKNNDKKLRISRTEFLNSLRRASIFVDPSTKRVKFEIKNSTINIKADNPEIGADVEEIIDCNFISLEDNEADFDKNPFIISFNVNYLIDCFSALESPEIFMTFSSPSKACVITPSTMENNEDYMELVMPVRVG